MRSPLFPFAARTGRRLISMPATDADAACSRSLCTENLIKSMACYDVARRERRTRTGSDVPSRRITLRF